MSPEFWFALAWVGVVFLLAFAGILLITKKPKQEYEQQFDFIEERTDTPKSSYLIEEIYNNGKDHSGKYPRTKFPQSNLRT